MAAKPKPTKPRRAEDGRMRIVISYVRPVELTDLTNYFSAIVNEYRRFAGDQDDAEKDLRLCVHEIAPGSIKIDLALKILGGSLLAMSAANTVHDFCRNIVDTIALLKGPGALGGAADGIDGRRLGDYRNLCVVIAKDSPGATISIGTVAGGEFSEMGLVTQADAQGVVGNVQALQRRQAAAKSARHEKVLLYWDRISRPDEGAGGGADKDKATIDDISDRAIKVNYDGDLKNEMFADDKNFFKYAYLVDVTVRTVRGEPTMYIVNRYHDKTKIKD
jgi:hypothetical protein